VIRTNSKSSDRLANCTLCHCNPSLLWAAQERLVTCPEYVGILGQPLLPESAVCFVSRCCGVEVLFPRTTNDCSRARLQVCLGLERVMLILRCSNIQYSNVSLLYAWMSVHD
jgi:hypothetical protein